MPPATGLTAKDIQLVTAVAEQMKIDANWEDIAAASEHATAKYARDRWAVVRGKITSPSGFAELSEKDLRLFNALAESIKGLDWANIAATADYKTSKYARDRWTVVKRKLTSGTAGGQDGASAATTPAATPKATPKKARTPKKRKAADEEDAESASVPVPATPTPTPKKRAKKKETAKADEDGPKKKGKVAMKAEKSPEKVIESRADTPVVEEVHTEALIVEEKHADMLITEETHIDGPGLAGEPTWSFSAADLQLQNESAEAQV